ncbi:MAG: ATP phosphoribosyltransferase regulatory subunit [Candidatus Pacearchaeota archaeon]|jgi:histidyl-tRNA synthetase
MTKKFSEPVKGFKDYTEAEAIKRSEIRKILVETFEKYGYEPAETPIIEDEKFVRGENPNDEAVSDIYRLRDKGKRKLALRYEFTFQLKRLMQNKKLPFKRYQIGEVFRDEPTSQNRFRQFTQCDVDVVGSTIKDEAELLSIAKEVLEKLGLEFAILINNRKLLNEILDDLKIKKKREEILRELDKLDKQGLQKTQNNLYEFGAGDLLEAITQGEEYFSKFESYKEIISLMEYCKLYNVKIKFSPTIIRGLSYYNGTVFEIKSKDVKETITAGGSYQFNQKQCSGISFGLDRLAIISKLKNSQEKYLVVSLEEDKAAINLAQKLRKKNKNTTLFYGKPSKALEFANSKNINNVIFVGGKEVKEKKFKVKDMKSGKESRLII